MRVVATAPPASQLRRDAGLREVSDSLFLGLLRRRGHLLLGGDALHRLVDLVANLREYLAGAVFRAKSCRQLEHLRADGVLSPFNVRLLVK
jgi:hypothetical protein